MYIPCRKLIKFSCYLLLIGWIGQNHSPYPRSTLFLFDKFDIQWNSVFKRLHIKCFGWPQFVAAIVHWTPFSNWLWESQSWSEYKTSPGWDIEKNLISQDLLGQRNCLKWENNYSLTWGNNNFEYFSDVSSIFTELC